jgi:hypothetical protein
MKFTAYYVIEPKNSFLDLLLTSKDFEEFREILSEKKLWSKDEGGRTALTENEYINEMKLAYMAELWIDYIGSTNLSQLNSIQKFLIDFLKFPLTTDDFDKWWTITRFEGIDANFSDVSSEIDSNTHIQIKNKAIYLN